MKFVDILFPLPINNALTYIIPPEMENDIKIGQIVLAKIKQNYQSGIVVGFKTKDEIEIGIKYLEISDIIEHESLLFDEQIKISKWVADYYLCNWGEVVSVFLPSGVLQKSKKMVKLKNISTSNTNSINDVQQTIIEFIKDKNYVSLNSIAKKTKIKNIHYHIEKLKFLDLVEEKKELSKKKAIKLKEKFYSLKENNKDKILEKIKPNAFLQKTLVEELQKTYPSSISQNYITTILNINSTVIKRLKDLGIIKQETKEIYRKQKWNLNVELSNLDLNQQQQNVLEKIHPEINLNKFSPFLLWGVTGSGKTQIYIEVARKILEMGKSVLILVPEISLTLQLINRFQFYLQKEVGVYHSKLSAGERYDIWRKAVSGEIKILIGARSAVFVPLKNIGLIVVDEEHENSYKQSDTTPRYNGRDVALYMAKQNKSLFIAGSATPSLEMLHLCQTNKMQLLKLNERVKKLPLPKISVVDLNHTAFSNNESSQLTESLLSEIQSRLITKEQVLLFKNIRGYSSYLQCADCRSIIKCSNCDVTLTWHKKGKYLSCHYCGKEIPAIDVCQECKSYKLQPRGAGTELIEEKLESLFNKKVLRLDLDSTRQKNAYIEKIEAFQKGEAEILVGTKMVTKGHDFPNLTLVGVLNADMEFSLPDFRATEKGLQTLLQVTGRSGRDEIIGNAIVQTYMPEHKIFEWLIKHDYSSFVEWEMGNRKMLNYPPFSRLILIRILSKNETIGQQIGKLIVEKLENLKNRKFDLLGPAFSPIKKINEHFRINILIKISKTNNEQVTMVKNYLRQNLHPIVAKNKNAKIYIDVDPVDTL